MADIVIHDITLDAFADLDEESVGFLMKYLIETNHVEEAVRCKDCKWRYTQDCPLVIATNYMANHGYGNFESKGDNGFCSWGKRK